jgi:actin-related protein
MKKLLLVIIVLLLVNTVAYGKDVDAYVELLKSDVRTQKVAIISKALQFTNEESSAFWPVHREYELELSKIIDDRIELIKDYAQNYDNLTNEKAKEIAGKVFDLEKRRTKLKKKYFKKFEKALSAVIAAKFVQVENQINLLIDLQIASELPLIK